MSDKKSDKNERVMHTRIPEALDQQLKQKAEGLGMSVSNLVRNVLLNTFDLVEDILTDSASIARSTAKTAPPKPAAPALPAPPAPETVVILGWQELILNLNALCHRCNAILPKGTSAYLGITNSPGSAPHFMCSNCLKDLNNDTRNPDTE